MSSIKYNMS